MLGNKGGLWARGGRYGACRGWGGVWGKGPLKHIQLAARGMAGTTLRVGKGCGAGRRGAGRVWCGGAVGCVAWGRHVTTGTTGINVGVLELSLPAHHATRTTSLIPSRRVHAGTPIDEIEIPYLRAAIMLSFAAFATPIVAMRHARRARSVRRRGLINAVQIIYRSRRLPLMPPVTWRASPRTRVYMQNSHYATIDATQLVTNTRVVRACR